MEQLIELLQQIQDLAGVAIDALEGAGKDAGGEKPPAEGGGGEQPPAEPKPPAEGGPPPEDES
jgi:hypothetical protein